MNTINQADLDDTPLQADQTEQDMDSYIGECDMTDCRFNKQHRCYAGSIQVANVNGMAHCATYDPKHHMDRYSPVVSESI